MIRPVEPGSAWKVSSLVVVAFKENLERSAGTWDCLIVFNDSECASWWDVVGDVQPFPIAETTSSWVPVLS